MGDKYTTIIKDSRVGAVSVGPGANASGTVEAEARLTQEEHRRAVGDAQSALVRDQEALDALDAKMYDALSQFLRLARDIQVEQRSLVELQTRMKDTLDAVWAEQVAKGMKPQVLSGTLQVAGEIAKNPVMIEVAKKLLGA